jgi:DNA-binding Lrp family transcriptional regulator
MKINLKEQKILSALQLNGSLTIKEISEFTGYTTYLVGKTIIKYKQLNLIKPYILINKFLLGYQKFGVYLKAYGLGRNELKAAFAQLSSEDSVVSVIETTGVYNYFVSFAAKSVSDFLVALEKGLGMLKGFTFEKDIAIRVDLTLFRRKYLAADMEFGNQLLRYKISDRLIKIDDIDEKILNFLRSKGHPNFKNIAEATKIPLSTVFDKIKSLENNKIIVGYPYLIDPNKLGFYSYDLFIKKTGFNDKIDKQIFQFCKRELYVVGLTKTLGSWDYEVRVEVPEAAYLLTLEQDLYELFKGELKILPPLKIERELVYMRLPNI